MKALVTDDSAFMRNMMKDILEDMDFQEVYEAEDGEEAVEIESNEDIDLITMDVIMEDKGGVEALKEIREENEEVDVIMVSAVGQDEIKEEADAEGCDAFVDKPFEEEDVKDTVSELLIS